MAVTFLIKFDVVLGQRERFLSLLEGVLDAMRDDPMFHEAILHCDPESAHRFMLYETWEDFDDVVNVQLRRAYREEWHDALPMLLTKDRDITLWTPIRDDRSAHRLPGSSTSFGE
ncbi:putative quinol monooxygenase [Ochrobactrum sp. BTU1]|uniref:putative quinol monooxygenase n=1 Tax=Ochrobactrum sp. BTU1 TaxID=2840456 RepID=UPI001C049B5B|nr:antibiotic biosynthesis monooxygenase [Ochrobactrum sp. BTU1]